MPNTKEIIPKFEEISASQLWEKIYSDERLKNLQTEVTSENIEAIITEIFFRDNAIFRLKDGSMVVKTPDKTYGYFIKIYKNASDPKFFTFDNPDEKKVTLQEELKDESRAIVVDRGPDVILIADKGEETVIPNITGEHNHVYMLNDNVLRYVQDNGAVEGLGLTLSGRKLILKDNNFSVDLGEEGSNRFVSSNLKDIVNGSDKIKAQWVESGETEQEEMTEKEYKPFVNWHGTEGNSW